MVYKIGQKIVISRLLNFMCAIRELLFFDVYYESRLNLGDHLALKYLKKWINCSKFFVLIKSFIKASYNKKQQNYQFMETFNMK